MVRIKSVFTILIYCISLLGAVPVFFYVDPVVRFIFASALIAGIFFDVKNSYHVKNIYLTILSVGLFLYYSAGFSSSNLVIPAMNILVILLSVRLLGEKSERNCMQIVVLSLFALAGSSLLDLSMTFLLYLVLFLVSIAVFLVIMAFGASGAERTVSTAELKKILAVALAMPALSFPLLVLFFVIIPRTQYPIWNFMNSSDQKVTGFSERVEPGSSASVREVKNVVFRAESPKLAEKNLYWRGIVMNTVQGNAWVRSDREPKENAFAGRGKVIRQTIFPEPGTGNYILALNVPEGIKGIKTEKSSDYVFVRKDSQQRRIKYDSISVLTDTIGVHGGIDRASYLHTPSRISSRVISLAKKLSGKNITDAEKLMSLENYFISGKYSYTTNNLPRSQDPMDDFLFAKKSGNCEFFAGSFAVLLRLMGIPSRLVGGYYGGEYNNLGGYYLVAEDMAHVWVEAFVEGKGWVMVDPSGFSVNFAPRGGRSGKDAFIGIQLMIDSLSYYWNQAVISYDLEKQFRILRMTNDAVKKMNFNFNAGKLPVFALPALLCIFYLISRKKYRYPSREEKILRSFLKKVRKKYPGAVIGPTAGLQELVKIVDTQSARQFADLYCGVVYRDRKLSGEEYHRLLKLVEKI
jgi:transglutaminase-like putative cysteine protease